MVLAEQPVRERGQAAAPLLSSALHNAAHVLAIKLSRQLLPCLNADYNHGLWMQITGFYRFLKTFHCVC